MAWYTETEQKQIDYSKPIMSTSTDGSNIYILLPVGKERSYDIIGYDWFNITKSEWNSCRNFKTVQEAIDCYSNVTNCEIELKPL